MNTGTWKYLWYLQILWNTVKYVKNDHASIFRISPYFTMFHMPHNIVQFIVQHQFKLHMPVQSQTVTLTRSSSMPRRRAWRSGDVAVAASHSAIS